MHRELYSHIFYSNTDSTNSSTHTVMKTPPLASILPQIKAISLKTLSENKTTSDTTSTTTSNTTATIVSNEIRDISSGPYLEAFCLAIFDTPLR